MKTCDICGTQFESDKEDVLIYGCVSCKKGFFGNRPKMSFKIHKNAPLKPMKTRSSQKGRVGS